MPGAGCPPQPRRLHSSRAESAQLPGDGREGGTGVCGAGSSRRRPRAGLALRTRTQVLLSRPRRWDTAPGHTWPPRPRRSPRTPRDSRVPGLLTRPGLRRAPPQEDSRRDMTRAPGPAGNVTAPPQGGRGGGNPEAAGPRVGFLGEGVSPPRAGRPGEPASPTAWPQRPSLVTGGGCAGLESGAGSQRVPDGPQGSRARPGRGPWVPARGEPLPAGQGQALGSRKGPQVAPHGVPRAAGGSQARSNGARTFSAAQIRRPTERGAFAETVVSPHW